MSAKRPARGKVWEISYANSTNAFTPKQLVGEGETEIEHAMISYRLDNNLQVQAHGLLRTKRIVTANQIRTWYPYMTVTKLFGNPDLLYQKIGTNAQTISAGLLPVSHKHRQRQLWREIWNKIQLNDIESIPPYAAASLLTSFHTNYPPSAFKRPDATGRHNGVQKLKQLPDAYNRLWKQAEKVREENII